MVAEHKNRLNSWKEIAAYIGYDESTIRRWERTAKFPVHRVGASKRSPVFAYPEEIDEWFRKSADEAAREPILKNPESSSKFGATDTSLFDRILSSVFGAWKVSLMVFFLASGMAAFLWHRHSHRITDHTLLSSPPPNKASDSVPEETAVEIKTFVKNAQVWEMLTLYPQPWTCDANIVKSYFDPASQAFNDVLLSVSRLNERNWHYGFGARLLDFEFRYVRLSEDGLTAEVGTREHWWLPIATRDGTVVTGRNADQGPYEVDYLLIKKDGRWFLRSTTTPYAKWQPKQITCKNWPL
jgi:predicted DNA-binding transcriptional regulator AlpA